MAEFYYRFCSLCGYTYASKDLSRLSAFVCCPKGHPSLGPVEVFKANPIAVTAAYLALKTTNRAIDDMTSIPPPPPHPAIIQIYRRDKDRILKRGETEVLYGKVETNTGYPSLYTRGTVINIYENNSQALTTDSDGTFSVVVSANHIYNNEIHLKFRFDTASLDYRLPVVAMNLDWRSFVLPGCEEWFNLSLTNLRSLDDDNAIADLHIRNNKSICIQISNVGGAPLHDSWSVLANQLLFPRAELSFNGIIFPRNDNYSRLELNQYRGQFDPNSVNKSDFTTSANVFHIFWTAATSEWLDADVITILSGAIEIIRLSPKWERTFNSLAKKHGLKKPLGKIKVGLGFLDLMRDYAYQNEISLVDLVTFFIDVLIAGLEDPTIGQKVFNILFRRLKIAKTPLGLAKKLGLIVGIISRSFAMGFIIYDTWTTLSIYNGQGIQVDFT